MGSNHRKIIIPEIVTENVLNNPEDTYKTPALLDILFKYFFNKDDDLSIFLAKNIEKKEILNYKNHIPEDKHKKFELIYFSSLLDDKKVEKRKKI